MRFTNPVPACLLLFTLLLFHGSGFVSHLYCQTVAEQKVFGQYRQFQWTDADGLAQNSVPSIAQTPDGYLWFATFEGVDRFDGANFTLFDGKKLQQQWSAFTALLTDRSGALWIANRNGALIRYQHEVVTVFDVTEGMGLIRQMIQDRYGDIWMATEASGLLRLHEGRFRKFTTREGLPANWVTSVAQDGSGRLWVSTTAGLVEYRNEQFFSVSMGEGLPAGEVTALCTDKNGALYAAVHGRIVRLDHDRFELKYNWENVYIRTLYCDRDNRIWAGSIHRGVLLLDGKSVQQYLIAPDAILSIFQDVDGAIWLGTDDSGVFALRPLGFEVFGVKSGMERSMRSILQDPSGTMWFGAESTFYSIKDWSRRKITGRDGITVAADTEGGIWLGANGNAFRYRESRLLQTLHLGLNSEIKAMLGDSRGNLWIGTAADGYCRWGGNQLVCFKAVDREAAYIVGFYEDRSGAIWAATQDGAERFKGGKRDRWTKRDGLATNQIASFYETPAGSLWIGGENGGLSRYKDGRFSKVTMDNGLFDNTAFAILKDDEDNLWMSCNRGIYRTSLRDLEDCADGKLKTVRSYSYGVADGMLTRECNGAFPAGWRSRDGRLWFSTINGVVCINPKLIKMRRMPDVVIEDIQVDRQPVPSSAVHMGPRQENVEIRYTVLHCARPKEAHFKVKLEGLDTDWRDLGVSRSVYYSHLPQGDYNFHVIADNGEGVWNLNGATLPLSIAGPFYKTWWFLCLCIISAGLITAFAWRLRMSGLIRAQQLQQQFLHRLIESQEQERKRIAGELHDGLAQRLTIVKNLALMNGHSQPGSKSENIGLIASEAAEALREVREISYALRPYQLDYLGLRSALESLVKKVAASAHTEFVYNLAGIEGLVGKDDEINLYRIVQECLQNIIKHSNAGHAHISVLRDGSRAYLDIEDDGVGFIPGMVNGGMGLRSIEERVQLLGGKLAIQAVPGKGTALRIELPTFDEHTPV